MYYLMSFFEIIIITGDNILVLTKTESRKWESYFEYFLEKAVAIELREWGVRCNRNSRQLQSRFKPPCSIEFEKGMNLGKNGRGDQTPKNALGPIEEAK